MLSRKNVFWRKNWDIELEQAQLFFSGAKVAAQVE